MVEEIYKRYGASPLGIASGEGDRVVVVDDVITTAGSTLNAIHAVEEIGCRVVGVICIVDREEGGAAALEGYSFHPLFKVSELLGESAAGV